MTIRTQLILALLIFIPFLAFSQELVQNIYGDREDKEIGFDLSCTIDGNTIAFFESNLIAPSESHPLLSVYSIINDQLIPIGSPINAALNFEDLNEGRFSRFDMSDDGEVIIIRSDSMYFHYGLQDGDWALQHTFDLNYTENEYSLVFSLSGDGKTLGIVKYNTEKPCSTFYIFEYVDQQWIKSNFNLTINEPVDSHIALSYDGTVLVTGIGKDNLFDKFHKVRVFKKSINEWNQIGQDFDFYQSFYWSLTKNLLSFDLSHDGKTLLISGIGNDGGSGDENISTAHVYTFEDNVWSLKGQVIEGYHIQDGFGQSTNISDDGDKIFISAIGAEFNEIDHNGIVKYYTYSNEAWQLSPDSIVGENTWDLCGFKTAISGDGRRLFVSCPFYDHNFSRSGRIGIYSLDYQTNTSSLLSDYSSGNIYPNPTHGIINFKKAAPKIISIFNQLGVQVYQSESVQEFLDLSFLNSGIYFLTIDNRLTEKIVILK